MEPVDLDKLDALRAATTGGGGRWVHGPGSHGIDMPEIAQRCAGIQVECRIGIGDHRSDVAWIVALHNAYPAMVEELRGLRVAARAILNAMEKQAADGIPMSLLLKAAGAEMRVILDRFSKDGAL